MPSVFMMLQSPQSRLEHMTSSTPQPHLWGGAVPILKMIEMRLREIPNHMAAEAGDNPMFFSPNITPSLQLCRSCLWHSSVLTCTGFFLNMGNRIAKDPKGWLLSPVGILEKVKGHKVSLKFVVDSEETLF